jgi:outer membrane immunogenic protein
MQYINRKGTLALLTFAAISVGAGIADAADLPVKAPVAAPVPTFSWTGFYFGVHGGAGWGTVESSTDVGALAAGLGLGGLTFVLPTSSHTINGFLAGGQIGWNWQATPNFVWGIEGNISWTNLEGNSPCVVIFNCSAEINWMADISGRLGFVPTNVPNLMVYVKGGVAWADTDYSFGNSIGIAGLGTFSATASESDTRIGFLLGMGAEYAFAQNWSAKIEYNYIDFGSESYNFPLILAAGGTITANAPVEIDQFVHVMKFGVNYRW